MKEIIQKILKKFGREIAYSHTIAMTTRHLETFQYIGRMMEKVEGVKGEIVECGVGKGRTYLYFSHILSKSNSHRMLYGFDSFVGFPEPSKEDRSERNPKKGEWAGISMDDIKRILLNAGIPAEWIKKHVVLVEGYLEDTLQNYSGDSIALLHIDVDLYSAYKSSLENLYEKVATGGLILFDEYGEDIWPGATLAVDEFLTKHGNLTLHKDSETGKYHVVKP